MLLNTLNQNSTDTKFSLNSFINSAFGKNFGNSGNSDSYYAKKGDPIYQKEMDSDNDGIISFEEFKTYCQENNISAKDMTKMLDARMSYKMRNEDSKQTNNINKEITTGNLDLIYAKDGDKKYDSELDTNKDSKISYIEYLRYCEQNAKMEIKNSDTKIVDYDKSKFMTVSFGHAASAYMKNISEAPKIKVEKKA